MPRLAKERPVDYTFQEFVEKVNHNREIKIGESSCKYIINKICERYSEFGIQISDFKSDPNDKNSNYFLTPDLVEILSILVRNYNLHPLSRSNADITAVKASDMQKYYAAVIYDIDNELSFAIKTKIYHTNAHFVAGKIADWINPFCQEFTYFLNNLTTLSQQDLGSALRMYTEKMEWANYCLFNGNSVLSFLNMNQQNVKIDTVLMYYLCDSLEAIKILRTKDLPRFSDESIYPGTPEGREKYIRDIIQYDMVNYHQFKNDKLVKDTEHIDFKIWKDIRAHIKDNDFDPDKLRKREGSIPLDQRIEYLKKQIEAEENKLQRDKDRLAALQMADVPDLSSLEYHDLDPNPQEYIEYCREVDANDQGLADAVDNFIGRVMYLFMQ